MPYYDQPERISTLSEALNNHTVDQLYGAEAFYQAGRTGW